VTRRLRASTFVALGNLLGPDRRPRRGTRLEPSTLSSPCGSSRSAAAAPG